MFHTSIDEINRDPVLRLYGAALALVNVVTAAYWLLVSPLAEILAPNTPPICWPFFTACDQFRVLSPVAVSFSLIVFLTLSLLNAALFVLQQARAAYWLLFSLSAAKAFTVLLDYRLVLNQHYMAFWVLVPFLLVPRKRVSISLLLVSFYFWAGILKLSPGSGWLTPDALYGARPFNLPASWTPAECLYVVVLELAVVWGLLSSRAWLFWTALAQFALFHFASFWVVGFFYPLEMFLLLTILPCSRWTLPPKDDVVPQTERLVGIRWSSAPLVAGFSILQVVPHLFPGNPSVSGEGRLFALNMFDAPLQCRARAVFGADDQPQIVPIRVPYLNERIGCDPIVYWSNAVSYCRHRRGEQETDFELVLETRRKGEGEFRRIVDIPHFCERSPSYSIWKHNDWILSPRTADARANLPLEVTMTEKLGGPFGRQ